MPVAVLRVLTVLQRVRWSCEPQVGWAGGPPGGLSVSAQATFK